MCPNNTTVVVRLPLLKGFSPAPHDPPLRTADCNTVRLHGWFTRVPTKMSRYDLEDLKRTSS